MFAVHPEPYSRAEASTPVNRRFRIVLLEQSRVPSDRRGTIDQEGPARPGNLLAPVSPHLWGALLDSLRVLLARKGHPVQEGPVRPAAGGAGRPSPASRVEGVRPQEQRGSGGREEGGPGQSRGRSGLADLDLTGILDLAE